MYLNNFLFNLPELKFNNNNYAGIECFGKVTGLDKVNDVYIVSIGTNSNLTLLLQSIFWILFLLLISKFKFQIKNVNFLNVFLLSIFFTFQQFSEDRFYALVNKYFDLSLNTSNFYLFNNFLILYSLDIQNPHITKGITTSNIPNQTGVIVIIFKHPTLIPILFP